MREGVWRRRSCAAFDVAGGKGRRAQEGLRSAEREVWKGNLGG